MNDTRPAKPTPDYPLFAHANGQWVKKVRGKMRYYGPWADPQAALDKYLVESHRQRETGSLPAKAPVAKPSKPRPDYPLYAHRSGQWAKKVRGKVHYFGAWADPTAALDKWLRDRDFLLTGRLPTPSPDGLTVKEVVNRFLHAKELAVASGDIKQRTWDDYNVVCDRVLKALGSRLIADLTPADFESLRSSLRKKRGPVAVGNDITRIRVLFKYAFDADLIVKPIKYGMGFKRPSRKVLRQERQKKGLLMFEAADLRRMLAGATKPLKAMILLGVNGAFGNTDVATLPFSAVDLEKGWVDYPRPKTAIPRRFPLWPETVQAIKEASKVRPKPQREFRNRVFITNRGDTWERNDSDNPVSKKMAKLLKKLGLHRSGLNFYSLRRTFETIGGEAKDQIAVDSVMGHCPDSNDMAAVYRQRISDERLQAVVNYVHDWLFTGTVESNPSALVAVESVGAEASLTAV